jgi:FemAB-related protein (PEP-CTERM system-associated)
MLKVRQADLTNARDRAAWDAYVQRHPQATGLHLAAWGLAIAKTFGHPLQYLLAEQGTEVVGLLPLIHVRSRLFGSSLSSTPFAVYGGPLADEATAHEALDEEAWAIAQRLGVGALEYRNRTRQRPDWAVKDSTYATFSRPLSPDSETNLKAIPRKQRAEVRKSLERDLAVAIDRDVDRHYAVYARSVRDLGTPVFPKSLFVNLMEAYGENADIVTVSHDGAPIASVLSFYFRGAVMPYYGGGTAAAGPQLGYFRLYWSLMEHAAKRGCTTYDFGRSKYGTGAFDFKKNWGFEPQPLTYEYRLAPGQAMPDLNPNNPKYKTMIEVWRRLPLPVANALGPMLSRSLG